MRRRSLAVAGALAAALIQTGCGEAPGETSPAAAAGKIIRVATFNAYLNRPAEGGLIAALSTPYDAQAKAVAEIIQRVNPDILLIAEMDYDALGRATALFQENYLSVSQNGAPPVSFPYTFAGPVNTGVHAGHDLDRDGAVTATPGSRAYGGDAFGFGEFPGQYGMALFSKYPFDSAGIRTFQEFLWKDMPGALLPDDPATPAREDWYAAAALAVFRLSSKSHWDAPVIIEGKRVHILASHPTPPVFDGEEDRNGRRNHDEIRFWADYVAESRGGYIYDDAGARGGLASGESFVIVGDFNADPLDGDGVAGAIDQLLLHPGVDAGLVPMSSGGQAQAALQGGANAGHLSPAGADTADFGDDPETGSGNLRLDYVLPSKTGLKAVAAGVFWPAPGEEGYDLVGPGFPVVSSDHRLVWVDLELSED